MEKKQDLRVVKTLEAIKKAFFELLEEKGFEAITIKDITEKARINRGTFYAHYHDKYHCLSSYESELSVSRFCR
jgi:AcrR family transcriptional regulator